MTYLETIIERLEQEYPDALCSLQYDVDWQLLFAVRLSAQTWWGSTIGDAGLNFSVRNGKRWIPGSIATAVCDLREKTVSSKDSAHDRKISGY